MIDTTAKAITAAATEAPEEWYANPWIWIVGIAVFILLFAAIVRGNNKND